MILLQRESRSLPAVFNEPRVDWLGVLFFALGRLVTLLNAPDAREISFGEILFANPEVQPSRITPHPFWVVIGIQLQKQAPISRTWLQSWDARVLIAFLVTAPDSVRYQLAFEFHR